MRTFIAVFVSLIVMLLMNTTNAMASTNGQFTYEVETGDIGTIKVVAQDKPTAFRAAGNLCFDRRVALYEKARGPISEERMLDIIDSCANLKW